MLVGHSTKETVIGMTMAVNNISFQKLKNMIFGYSATW
jgi:hypothetical protein